MDRIDTARTPVHLSLNAETVRRASALTSDLAATMDGLLADFVTAETRRRSDKERRIDDAFSELVEIFDEHGLIGAEFTPV